MMNCSIKQKHDSQLAKMHKNKTILRKDFFLTKSQLAID